MWIRVGGGEGGQPMWILIIFYNIIIKSANVDKGGGVNCLSIKCGINFFFNPSLIPYC